MSALHEKPHPHPGLSLVFLALHVIFLPPAFSLSLFVRDETCSNAMRVEQPSVAQQQSRRVNGEHNSTTR